MLRRLIPKSRLRNPLSGRLFPLRVKFEKNPSPRNGRTTSDIFHELREKIERFKTADDERFLAYINYRLDKALYTALFPHAVYQSLIYYLFRKDFVAEAFEIFDRMQKDGYLPSNEIESYVLAHLLAIPMPSPEPLIIQFANIVAMPEYTEQSLLRVLHFFSEYKVSKDIVTPVVESFRTSRSLNYIPIPRLLAPLASAATRIGRFDDAMELLSRSWRKPRIRSAPFYTFHAGIEMLVTIRNIRPWDKDSITRVIDFLAARNMYPNIVMMNILLSREARMGYLNNCMRMFMTIRQPESDMLPNRHTYSTMFAVYRRIKLKVIRKRLPHEPTKAISLRQLYLEFMLATQREGYHAVLASTSILNLALRAFMYQRDYAGAAIVISSFAWFRLPLDHNTYYIVIKLLIKRIWVEISGKRKLKIREVKWADRFLGAAFGEIELGEELIDHILYLLSRERLAILDPLYHFNEPRKADTPGAKFEMPTLPMMESVLPPEPLNFHYKSVPLTRILQRAIVGDIDPTQLLGRRNAAVITELKRRLIAARSEMIGGIGARKSRMQNLP